MFDHRLGSLLGKSIGEIHELSYPEYKDWKLFYSVEPWGWHINEYRLARLLAMLFNIYKPADVAALQPSDFVSDISKVIEDHEAEQEMIKEYEGMSKEDKRAYVIGQLKLMFGGLIK